MHSLTTAADPLAGYAPGESVLFSSPGGTLLTRGVRTVVGGGLGSLPDRVAAVLGADGTASSAASGTADGTAAEAAGRAASGLAAGAIGFDGAAHLVVPAAATWSGPLEPVAAAPRDGWRVRPVPAPEDYRKAVRRAVEILRSAADDDPDGLRKVVLARTLELDCDEPVGLRDLLRPLAGRDLSFAAPLPGGRTLIGASPELLVSRRGRTVLSNPLAGSAARSADPAEDRRRAEALTASAKDLYEHRLVVEAVADALQPYCARLQVPYTPELTSTETMWHLSTRVTGVLRDPGTPVLALAAALHPTPAVCGTPRAEARRVIEELEPFDRGAYTGLVGWTDAAGDGEWAVTLRCAEVAERTLRLFAGAGIVSGSDPEGELAETSAKFRTMLRALGVNTDALA
ncbi:isochorismate synthase [Planomonospora parontospora]|uniref:isochorismate synthase n=1 Tax=Planomonospora parontospora TaxID=58119 RepID=UPI001670D148|nr:isochorismate synthase [Planomonospora parontospora]GGL41826.1 isochorismate synthase DhbC [Planomonospora parontospora subsp. antibiotica]GII18292.1 isochorismate synthase DhbC [Planomonospora parontospora subsp. antibiotica]